MVQVHLSSPGKFLSRNRRSTKNHVRHLHFVPGFPYSQTFKEHLERLEMVLTRVRKHGLKLKLEKCNFLKRKVTYLRHEVSGDGISSETQKVAALKEWPVPTTEKELGTFLGWPLHQLVNESLHELKTIKKVSKPLTAKWNIECQQAFDTLREKLTTAPVLGYADYTKPFIVETDALF